MHQPGTVDLTKPFQDLVEYAPYLLQCQWSAKSLIYQLVQITVTVFVHNVDVGLSSEDFFNLDHVFALDTLQ